MKYNFYFKMFFDGEMIIEADNEQQAEEIFYDIDVQSFMESVTILEEDINNGNIKKLKIEEPNT